MRLEELEHAEKKVVGLKQLLREIKAETVVLVLVANDTDEHVLRRVSQATEGTNIPVQIVGTKEELGNAGGIKVPAACVAILK